MSEETKIRIAFFAAMVLAALFFGVAAIGHIQGHGYTQGECR